MPQMSQVLKECAIGIADCRNVHQNCFLPWPYNHRPLVWRHMGEQFADVNVVNRVPHGGDGVMVWAGISYRQRTQLHFIDGNFNAQKYRDEILRPVAFLLQS